MRGNEAATSAWVESQRGTFGPFTEPMHRFGLFNVFHAKWFLIALGFLVVNVTTCTLNRWSPTFRNVFHPPKRVPDSFYDRAHNRATLAPVSPAALDAGLRRMRFRVETTETRDEPNGGATTYVFADRYPWTQLATFVSHLALILFIAGGLVSWLTGFSSEIFVGEGTTAPVFAVSDPDQMQVRVDDTVGTFGDRGNPLDFRTHLTIFKNGEQVAEGTTTVNDPFKYGGYRFHQAAFFDEGAQLRIREVATGNTVFNETFPLIDTTAAPAITITDDAGNALLDDVIAPADFLPGATGSLVRVPATGQLIWIGLTTTQDEQQWQLVAFDPAVSGEDGQGGRLRLDERGAGSLSGLTIRFDAVTSIPAAVGVDVPGSDSNVLAQRTQSEGGDVLMLVSEDRPAISLAPGEPVTVGAYEYTYEGAREFSGIAVRRDRGAWFIWVATAMLVGGLALTFYVPRRRLWIRLTPRETQVAALAEKSGGFEQDMRTLASRIGAPIPPELQEEHP
jgi:cytochrome c biogenesis protein